MAFDWQEYFKLAEELCESKSEAKIRSSISRAYYAVFNISKQIIEKVDPFEKAPSLDAHKWLIDYFNKSQDKFANILSENIKELRNARNKADYKSPHISVQEAKQALKLAELIIKKLEKFSQKL